MSWLVARYCAWRLRRLRIVLHQRQAATVKVLAAAQFLQHEIDSNPIRIAPDGTPAVEHYLVVLSELQVMRRKV